MSTETLIPSQKAAPKRLSLGLMALAVLSSMAASSCCVLPLVLVLVGLGGAWMANLAALKPFIGLFTVIALAALAGAGYLVFRSASFAACSADGRDCNAACRRARHWFIGCALFIGLLLLFPLAAPLFY